MTDASPKPARLRRFRFNLPQRIAAGLLLSFLAQGFWRIAHVSATQASCFSGATQLHSLLSLALGTLLAGALWWVTRRMFGNLGGYLALALYCFSPAVLWAVTTAPIEVLAMLGVYACLYTAIGVAHALQGPRRKLPPRLVLLTLAFALAAAAHLATLGFTLLLAVAFMFWIAEGRRALIVPILLATTTAALALCFVLWVVSGFVLGGSGKLATVTGNYLAFARPVDLHSVLQQHAGLALALVAALMVYATARRSRFFGNTVPLLTALFFGLLIPVCSLPMAALWSLPFLCTFIAGAFADACESPRRKWALAAGGALALLQLAAEWMR